MITIQRINIVLAVITVRKTLAIAGYTLKNKNMLKYLYCKEVFREIPGEISLGLSISGCQIRCHGCHSRELWEDKGTPLTKECLEELLEEHKGITCLLILGAEHDMDSLTELFMYAHKRAYKSNRP